MEILKDTALSVVNPVVNYFRGLYDGYVWTLTLEEPYVQAWPLVKSPVPMFTLIFCYYNMVYFGPKIMMNREPFKLKWLLIVYNLGITLLNLYIAVGVFYNAYKLDYSWICQPYNPVDSPEEVQLASALWWYWFSKFIEFADTLFFILRKKDRQLTFLHVYHHSTMFFLWWIGIKWVPNGASFVGAGLNAVVHVLMYSYYALSALGPSVRKYLWWKKYLTMVQLVQFTIALLLGINALRINCDFPKWMQYTLITYMVSFIILFSNFYTHAYTKRRFGKHKKDDDYNNCAIVNGTIKNVNGSDLNESCEMNGAKNHYQNGSLKNKYVANGSTIMAYSNMNGLTKAVFSEVTNGHMNTGDHNHSSNNKINGDVDVRFRKIAK